MSARSGPVGAWPHGLGRLAVRGALMVAWRVAVSVALAVALGPARAGPTVVDDRGQTIRLARPAQRIVAIGPHVTELLFAAGAGARVVGVSDFSDYPPAARALPRVGGVQGLDLERLLALRPDLVVVWLHGISARQLDALGRLGLPLYYDEPRHLDDIPRSVERLAVLAGSESVAREHNAAWRQRLAALRAEYAGRPVVTVFHQVWTAPLMTVSGRHVISDVIGLCGGRNLFADDELLVPLPSLEAVIVRDPEVITAAGVDDQPADFDLWRAWPRLQAVRRQQLVTLPADLISRHSPRLLDGARLLCEALDRARRQRP